MKSILFKKYQKEALPLLKEKFGYKNNLAVPKIEKVSVNIGINARSSESNYADNVEDLLAKITGQKPIKTKAKKAISAFKIRQGLVVGVKTTLRGQRIYGLEISITTSAKTCEAGLELFKALGFPFKK